MLGAVSPSSHFQLWYSSFTVKRPVTWHHVLDSNKQRQHRTRVFEVLVPAFSECLITAAAGAAAILNIRECFSGFIKHSDQTDGCGYSGKAMPGRPDHTRK